MKKKTEKIQEVEERAKEMGEHQTLILTSFTKIPVNDLNDLRKTLSPKDMLEASSIVYRFAKAHDTFAIVGGVQVAEKQFVPASDVIRLGQLPSREVLLGQLVGMLVSPIRSFLFVLNEKAKRGEVVT